MSVFAGHVHGRNRLYSDRLQTQAMLAMICSTALMLSGCGGEAPSMEAGPLLGAVGAASRPDPSVPLVIAGSNRDYTLGETRERDVFLPHAASVRYCLELQDPYIERVSLLDGTRRTVWTHDGASPCPEGVSLAAGDYRLALKYRPNYYEFNIWPVFVHSVADGERGVLRAPSLQERWPIRFAQTGNVMQIEAAGTPRTGVQAVAPQNLQALDGRHLLATVPTVIEGYEQLRLYSQGIVTEPAISLRQKSRSMFNWDDAGVPSMSASVDAQPLPASGNAQSAYLVPLGGYRFAYCAWSEGFEVHRCLGQREDGSIGMDRTKEPPYTFGALENRFHLLANPRYMADASSVLLSAGQVFFDYTPSDGSTAQGGLIYGEDTAFVPPQWTPSHVQLGPDTEVSLDGGEHWIGTSGPITPELAAVVRGVTIRRTAWNMQVSSLNCKGCDFSTINGRIPRFSTFAIKTPGVDLSGANFAGQYLVGTNFENARLRQAHFTGANLQGAVFRLADLTGARLRNTNLSDSQLTGASLRDVDFSASHFAKANFADGSSRTTVVGTRFDGTNLVNANLSGLFMACVSMRWTRTMATNLENASLQCMDLSHADVRGMRFGMNPLLYGEPGQSLPVNMREQCNAVLGAMPEPSGLFRSLSCKGLSLVGAQISAQTLPAHAWRRTDMRQARIEGFARRTDDPDCAAASSDSSGASLESADLSEALLDGVDLGCARLRNANFQGASLRAVQLQKADMTGAKLSGANLSCNGSGSERQCAGLQGVLLNGAILANANISAANFTGAIMNARAGSDSLSSMASVLSGVFGIDAIFSGVDLTGVNFTNAQLYGKKNSFRNSTLVNTNFAGANLSDVDFAYARLRGTIFTNATLVNARFTSVDIGLSSTNGQTNFDGAALHGASFEQSNAYHASFNGASVPLTKGTHTVNVLNAKRQLVPRTMGFNPTVLPLATDASTTCANGYSGPCQASMWAPTPPAPPRCVPQRRGELDQADPEDPPVNDDFQYVCPWP